MVRVEQEKNCIRWNQMKKLSKNFFNKMHNEKVETCGHTRADETDTESSVTMMKEYGWRWGKEACQCQIHIVPTIFSYNWIFVCSVLFSEQSIQGEKNYRAYAEECVKTPFRKKRRPSIKSILFLAPIYANRTRVRCPFYNKCSFKFDFANSIPNVC